MPTFTFTSPDGKNYDVEGPEGATQAEAFAMLQQHMQQNPPSAAERIGGGLKRATGITARALATGATGLAGVVADPIVGLANIGRNVAAKAQGEPMPEQMKMPSRALQDTMTAAGLPEPEGFAENTAMMVGALAGGKIDPLSNALTSFFKGSAPLYQTPQITEKAKTIREGMQAGLKVAPSQSAGGAGPLARTAEAFGGAGQGQEILRTKNQALVDAMLRREAGLTKDAHLNNDTLDGAIKATFTETYKPIIDIPRISNGSIYRQNLMKVLADYGDAAPGAKNEKVQDLVQAYMKRDFTGSQAVTYIKTLRANANKAFISSEPGSNELGYANKAIADAIENSIEINLTRNPAISSPDLLNHFRAGRRLMAKQEVVKDTVLEGTGSGQALHLGAELQRNPRRLTGDLRTIGKMANAAPDAMKMPKTDPKLFNTWETGTGAYGLGRLMSGDMSGLFFAGLPIARLAARQGLATDTMQKVMQPRLDPGILNSLGNKPGVLNSLPVMMQQYGLMMNPEQK